jgi:hypothetical protein
MKSTPEEIRARFDKDVERFSNLETGQYKKRVVFQHYCAPGAPKMLRFTASEAGGQQRFARQCSKNLAFTCCGQCSKFWQRTISFRACTLRVA